MMSYHDLNNLKDFFKQNPLHRCFREDNLSLHNTYEFLTQLAYNTEDIGRCISLMINIVTVTTLQKFSAPYYVQYKDSIINGEYITAICNNEALAHGSNLNAMSSFIQFNEENSCHVKIDKKIITNVGAADLLFINLAIKDKVNNFAIALFEGHEINQKSISNELNGLTSCPSGSVQAEFIDYKHLKLLTSVNKSLLIMRHMYNMERFFIGCIMSGILQKIIFYAFNEQDNDTSTKFTNQYVQEKIIRIFDIYIKLDSLLKNCIQYFENNSTIDPLLAVIKMASINEGFEAILLFKELCGAKSYFKKHITHRLLADHEALFNLGGTKELMKQTLFNDLKNQKTRDIYV